MRISCKLFSKIAWNRLIISLIGPDYVAFRSWEIQLMKQKIAIWAIRGFFGGKLAVLCKHIRYTYDGNRRCLRSNVLFSDFIVGRTTKLERKESEVAWDRKFVPIALIVQTDGACRSLYYFSHLFSCNVRPHTLFPKHHQSISHCIQYLMDGLPCFHVSLSALPVNASARRFHL